MREYQNYSRRLKIVEEKDEAFHKAKITSSKDIFEYASRFYHDDINIYESMFMVMLNRANNTDAWVKISQGGITGTVVDVRIILKYAVETLCSSVILVHNHPSGNLFPSQADKDITIKLQNALRFFDVQLLDHLILCDDKYYSFADEGLL